MFKKLQMHAHLNALKQASKKKILQVVLSFTPFPLLPISLSLSPLPLNGMNTQRWSKTIEMALP